MAKGTCEVETCRGPVHAKGLCGTHYMRLLRYGDPGRSRGTVSQTGWTRPIESRVRKYSIDHGFFDNIDSEEKAYWLGFFTADGCILNGRKLQINLHAKDAGHLTTLNLSMSSNHPILPNYRSPQSGPSVRWVASSAPLVRALAVLGVGPRKSADVRPWDGPADLMRHYWRGMVDGDGGIGTFHASHRSYQWRIYLAGSKPCVEAFASWAAGVCGSRSKPRPNGRSMDCWFWAVGGNRMAKLLANRLYAECHVSLPRKQALANHILEL